MSATDRGINADGRKTVRCTDSLLEYMKKHLPPKKITAAVYMDMSGIPREEWGGERISMMPRQFRREAEKLASQARRAAER